MVAITWKSFLLRPYPKARSLEKFRAYTESWARPAGQSDGGRFRTWSTENPPPSHSLPPLVACKAAALLDAFDRFHLKIMDAYFFENRDVSDRRVQIDVAGTLGLDTGEFAKHLDDTGLVQQVLDEHNEAVERGITGVPTVVAPGDFMIPGAQDLSFYRRLVQKLGAM